MIKLYLIDEIKVKFEGLPQKHINYIRTRTKKYVKGYFQTAAFKTGNWDGKESHFREDGFTFFYMLEDVFECLKELDYDVDNDITVTDYREFYEPPKPITEDFLSDYGITLRYYQKEAVNAVVEAHKGIIDMATSSGKTIMSLALVKTCHDAGMRSITIVPSETLLNQTFKQYNQVLTDVVKITKNDDLDSCYTKVENMNHFVVTWQKLKNIREVFEDFRGLVIYDETHQFSDVMEAIMSEQLADAPIRVGMTGSVPKDKFKFEKICCHMGNGIIYRYEAHEMMNEGYASKASIYLIETDHKHFHNQFDQRYWDWDKETTYLNNNKERIESIGEYIRGLPTKNTMVLCSKQMANNLSQYLDIPCIDGGDSTAYRENLYDQFENQDDNLLACSYGTSSVGISIDRIFRLILIDIGKDYKTVVQSIGRGLRKDGEINEVEIYDISADSKYGKRHKKDRMKIYSKHNYHHYELNEKIMVF